MRRIYENIALAYFVAATVFLTVVALALLVTALWKAVVAVAAGEEIAILESSGLVIIGIAMVETAKFFAEEEILRRKELRSAVESRRSLTKFITILIIAAALEALVMVFETSRSQVSDVVYPAALLGVAMFALVALGLFQWLSSRIAPPPDEVDPDDDASIDHHSETESEPE